MERLVFGLGLLAWEDFQEILNLAGNGFGFGAQKILRGMFERTVTMAYLFDHPDQAERFIDFEHVRVYKLAREAFDSAGVDAVSSDRLAELKAESDAVKSSFARPCRIKGCSNTIDSLSWNELDIFSMASAAKRGLRREAWLAYGAALGETHATVQAIKSRMSEAGDSFTFAEHRVKARDFGTPVVVIANRLILQVFDVQLDQFSTLVAECKPKLDGCVRDFLESWRVDPREPNPLPESTS